MARLFSEWQAQSDPVEAVLSAVGAGVVVHGPDGRIVWANGAAQRSIGLSSAQVQGRDTLAPGWTVCDARGVPLTAETHPIGGVLATGEPAEHVLVRMERPDGVQRWLDVSIHPLPQGAGAVSTFTDVTDMREARTRVAALEATLARSQDVQSLIMDGVKLGTWRWVVGAATVTVNAHWCAMLGLPVVTQLPFDVWVDALHPDDREGMLDLVQAHVADGQVPFLAEYRLQHTAGHWVHTLSVARGQGRGADGRATDLIGVNLDISYRRQAEAALVDVDQALQALDEGVLLIDGVGRVHRANRTAVELLGGPCNGMRLAKLLRDFRATADPLLEAVNANLPWQGDLWASGESPRVCRARIGAPSHPGARRPLVLTDVTAARSVAQERSQDPLTQLSNRRALLGTLEQAIDEKQPFALVFLDLDRFKPVNDRLGHAAGDAVLRTVAGRLRRRARPTDCLARFGGDEFVIVLRGIRSDSGAQRAMERMVAALDEPMMAGAESVQLGASAGVSRFPRDGDTPAALLRVADEAMLAIKRSRPRPGRSTHPMRPVAQAPA